MRRRIVQRPQAERDLIEIWTFIADDNEQAADRLLDRFDRAFHPVRQPTGWPCPA